MRSNNCGGGNVAIRISSGCTLVTGGGNVFIGKKAGCFETGSNKLYIDNTDTSSPLIYGEFDNELLHINGPLLAKAEENVEASTTNLTALEISGTVTNNYGVSTAVTYTLPAAASGYNFIFIAGDADQVHIDPNSPDKINLDGTLLDDGSNAVAFMTKIGSNGYYSSSTYYSNTPTWGGPASEEMQAIMKYTTN